jgi:hypothetical protein
MREREIKREEKRNTGGKRWTDRDTSDSETRGGERSRDNRPRERQTGEVRFC